MFRGAIHSDAMGRPPAFARGCHNERLFALGHSRPAGNFVQRAEAAETTAVVIQLANACAWRLNTHAGKKSQNQKPLVCLGPGGQT